MFNIPKTKQEIAKQELTRIDIVSRNALEGLKRASVEAYNMFWNNPASTPQEMCDALGPQAYRLFQTSAQTQDFIKVMNPMHTPLAIPEDKEVVFNKDGTVTITDKIPV